MAADEEEISAGEDEAGTFTHVPAPDRAPDDAENEMLLHLEDEEFASISVPGKEDAVEPSADEADIALATEVDMEMGMGMGMVELEAESIAAVEPEPPTISERSERVDGVDGVDGIEAVEQFQCPMCEQVFKAEKRWGVVECPGCGETVRLE